MLIYSICLLVQCKESQNQKYIDKYKYSWNLQSKSAEIYMKLLGWQYCTVIFFADITTFKKSIHHQRNVHVSTSPWCSFSKGGMKEFLGLRLSNIDRTLEYIWLHHLYTDYCLHCNVVYSMSLTLIKYFMINIIRDKVNHFEIYVNQSYHALVKTAKRPGHFFPASRSKVPDYKCFRL